MTSRFPLLLAVFLHLASCSLISVYGDTVLNFPRATFAQGQFTGFAIANPNDTDAEVTLTAYRSDGSVFSSPGLTNPAKVTISARRQRAFLLSDRDIFGATPELINSTQPVRLWLQATSPVSGLTGFYLQGDNTLQTLDGSDPSAGLTTFVFLLLDEGAGISTDLRIVNPGDAVANISVEFRRADGTVAGTSNLPPLAAKAALQGTASELFPNRSPDTAYLNLKSDTALAADALVQDAQRPSLAVLGAQRTVAQSRLLNFPQLVDGGDWSSEITVLSLSDTPLILTFRAFQENGALFVPPALTNNTVQRTLSPRAILKTSAAEVFGFRQDVTQAGWLQVEANDAGLTGFIAYGTRSNPTRAVVAAQHTPVTRAVFSHQAEAAGFFTGLAVLNASALTANVEVFSLNADGSLRGRTKQALKPNQRQSKVLREWVPAAEGVAGGYILLRSDVPVIATEVFGTASLTALANVPPQPIQTDLNPAASIPNLKVLPPMAVLETKTTQQFQASGITNVTWSVDAAAGTGSPGAVNAATGLFTAPDRPPESRTVSLVATAADGSQKTGATVDIIERNTLASGLSVVRAVAYLTSSKRFFLAEQQGLSKEVTSGGSTRISELKGTAQQLLINVDETVEKILPFVDRTGKEILLLAGFDTGRIYRLDPNATPPALVPIITGLLQPTSMAFTDTGDLAVAEQGANQIQITPRSQLDSTKTNAPEVRRIVAASAPQGVAVDTCTGEIFFTDPNGNLIGVLAGQTRVVASGLVKPTEILILRRRGMRCPNGITLFVVEEGGNRVLCIAPQISPAPLVFLSNLNAPRDLAFLPQGNNLADDPNQASISVSDQTSIQQTQVSKLYTTQTEPIVPVVDPDLTGGKVTITISGSSKLVVKHLEGFDVGKTETASLTINLTFAGTTLINGKFLPLDRVFFDIGSMVPNSFGSLSGTLNFSSVISGVATETRSFTFNGQRVLAAADRQKGVAVLMDFDFPALNEIASASNPRIRALDSNAPALLLIILTGADFKTVDTIAGGENKPEGDEINPVFLRSGGVIAPFVEELQILSSESSYSVTIR
jgi:hypothetical protein